MKVVLDLPDEWVKALKHLGADAGDQSVTATLGRLVEQSPEISDDMKAKLPPLVKRWGKGGKDTKDRYLTNDTSLKEPTLEVKTPVLASSKPVERPFTPVPKPNGAKKHRKAPYDSKYPLDTANDEPEYVDIEAL